MELGLALVAALQGGIREGAAGARGGGGGSFDRARRAPSDGACSTRSSAAYMRGSVRRALQRCLHARQRQARPRGARGARGAQRRARPAAGSYAPIRLGACLAALRRAWFQSPHKRQHSVGARSVTVMVNCKEILIVNLCMRTYPRS